MEKGEGAVKAFCVNCGSSLFGGDWPDGPQVSIRMGAFDDDPGIRPQFHTFVDDRAPWDEITDKLPQSREAWSAERGPDLKMKKVSFRLCLPCFSRRTSTRAISKSRERSSLGCRGKRSIACSRNCSKPLFGALSYMFVFAVALAGRRKSN